MGGGNRGVGIDNRQWDGKAGKGKDEWMAGHTAHQATAASATTQAEEEREDDAKER